MEFLIFPAILVCLIGILAWVGELRPEWQEDIRELIMFAVKLLFILWMAFCLFVLYFLFGEMPGIIVYWFGWWALIAIPIYYVLLFSVMKRMVEKHEAVQKEES